MASIKAGNIKAVILPGKQRYVVEFTSDTEGRAYEPVLDADKKVVKNESGLPKKGPFYGIFTRVPLGVRRVVENAPEGTANVLNKPKEENKPKNENKPTVIPKAAPKPTVAAPKPKVADAKPKTTPAIPKAADAKPKAAPAPKRIPVTETQQGLGCGRHALNNLFGRIVFVKDPIQSSLPYPPGPEPYSLLTICAEVSRILKTKGIDEPCECKENYDVNTLIGALDYLGYESEQFSPDKAIPEGGEFVGFIVNLGAVKSTSKHWVALQFKRRDESGTVYYNLLDSLQKYAREDITLQQFMTEFGSNLTIKVLLPRKESFPIESRYVGVPNAVPEGAEGGGKTRKQKRKSRNKTQKRRS